MNLERAKNRLLAVRMPMRSANSVQQKLRMQAPDCDTVQDIYRMVNTSTLQNDNWWRSKRAKPAA